MTDEQDSRRALRRAAEQTPRVVEEGPSPDVDVVGESARMPGAHRAGFQRWPTAPVEVTSQSAPSEPGTEDGIRAEWVFPEERPPRGVAGWALAFSIVGLLASLLVGWAFPLGLVGIVTAIVALRRPFESRGVAVWAIALGVVSVVYSALWLVWAASRANLFG